MGLFCFSWYISWVEVEQLGFKPVIIWDAGGILTDCATTLALRILNIFIFVVSVLVMTSLKLIFITNLMAFGVT